MRSFEIYDATRRGHSTCALLEYDEERNEMRIRIADGATPDDLPFLLGLFAERGEKVVPDVWARRWVQERVPPSSRQNIGEVLRANGLDSYDSLELLAAAQGRSSQDDFLVRETHQRTEYAVVDLRGSEGGEAKSSSASRSWCAILGPQIAANRKKLGLTQRELAEKTGIEQAAISRIEGGLANPTIDTLDTLAKALGCSLVMELQ